MSNLRLTPPLPKDNLATKFAASFSDYANRSDYHAILRPVETELVSIATAACSGRPFDGSECRDLVETAARGLAKQAVAGPLRATLCGIAANAESPLELALCLAVGMTARGRDYSTLYDFGGGKVYGDVDGDVSVKIQPQVCMGAYRVDFLLTMQVIEPCGDDIRIFTKQVIVECDGHQFHDNSKEQVAADKQRDRFLQSQALTVFHYAGSEIWADVFKCAEEVIDYLWQEVRKQRTAAEPPRKRPQSFEAAHNSRCSDLR